MDLALEMQTQARKERLAKLRSLKRKQEGPESTDSDPLSETNGDVDASALILSGRNYDVETKAPKLGFNTAPSKNEDTLESQAEAIALGTKNTIEDEDETSLSIDLLSLQPKKPNWDLKRDVNHRLRQLDQMTSNAISRVLRDSIVQMKYVATDTTSAQTGSMNENLVELVRQREHERGSPVEAEDV